jgi:protein TonB
MGVVRQFRPHGLAARPAGALSHAPPAFHLTPESTGDERLARARPSWPWQAVAVSAFLHAAAAGVLMWWHPSPQVSAHSVVTEIVFMPGPDAGMEAPSGAMQAQEDPPPTETPPVAETVSEPVADPEPPVAPEPIEAAAAETAIEPPPEAPPPPEPEPVASVVQESPPEPVPVVEEAAPEPTPVEIAEGQPEPAPVEPEMAPPVEIARPLPPPPLPRPVPVKSKPIERKPPTTEPTPPKSEPAEAAPVAVSVATVPAPSAPAPPATSAAPPAPPAESSEPPVVHEPRYRHPPTPPRFPPRALELNQHGTVVVRALVGPDGASHEIIVWRSSGFALLDQAALRAVREWAFEPASIGGRRIASWVEVPVRFAIR